MYEPNRCYAIPCNNLNCEIHFPNPARLHGADGFITLPLIELEKLRKHPAALLELLDAAEDIAFMVESVEGEDLEDTTKIKRFHKALSNCIADSKSNQEGK